MRFIIVLLISALGFTSCGAVSSSFLPEEKLLQAKPSKWLYGINAFYDKYEDLDVLLYSGGGLSKIPIDNVNLFISGEPVIDNDHKFFEPGIKRVDVVYSEAPGRILSDHYSITVLSQEEEDEIFGAGSGGSINIGWEEETDAP
ncbi:hypothetical protein AGMMS4952_04880 [Spirochaetia bacterium]|nr:hypothetical protein AGMMS4952_04880 [Spirochaetia bacterium]